MTPKAERGDGPGTTDMPPVDEPREGVVGDSPRPAGGVAVDAPSASAGNVAAPAALVERDAEMEIYRKHWGHLRERHPLRDPHGWKMYDQPAPNPYAISASAWYRGSIAVVSSVAVMEWPAGGEVQPVWLLSVRRTTGRLADMRKVLRAFGMAEAVPLGAAAFVLPIPEDKRDAHV